MVILNQQLLRFQISIAVRHVYKNIVFFLGLTYLDMIIL